MKPRSTAYAKLADVRPGTLEPPAELRRRVGGLIRSVARHLPLGAVAATGAAIATVAARHVLLTAAVAAERAGPGHGNYWYTRELHMSIDQVLEDSIVRQWSELKEITNSRLIPLDRNVRGEYLIESRFRDESWHEPTAGASTVWVTTKLGARPARPEDELAWRRAGSPRSWAVEGAELEDRDGNVLGTDAHLVHAEEPEPVVERTYPNRDDSIYWLAGHGVSLQDLAALPTDPMALKAEFLRRFTGEGSEGGPCGATYWIYDSARNLILEMPVPPGVRAATFRMLADLPEMRVIHDVVDPLGRAATAVAMRNPEITDGAYEDRLLIDAKTGVGLGTESYVLERSTDRPWAPPGLRLFWTAVEAAHWTDERPEPVPDSATNVPSG